jgi:Ca-activated chloride channel homolog
MRKATTFCCFALLSISMTASVAGQSGQVPLDQPQSPQTFKSAVDLVTIQASVRDRRGRPLTGLTTSDFDVRDNGQPRPVLSLRADVQSPVSVAILVDMSGSMRVGPKIAMARQAFESVLSQLRAGEDEAALFTFDSALHERHEFTHDLMMLRGALAEFNPFGSTSLYDATAEAARRVAARSGTHKALIVLTDGIDTSSALTASEVSGLASSIDVPVYVVATVPSLDQRAMMEGTDRARAESADLRDLAEWTGGQFMFASTFSETIVAAANLVVELRQQYVLAIEAAGAGEWRRLDVRVKHPAAKVKARSGYFGG